MNVVFAANVVFLPHLYVALASLLDMNKDGLAVHVFYVEIGEGEIIKLQAFAHAMGLELHTYLCDKHVLESFSNPGHYSWATYLRLMVASVLDEQIDKVLYLDCDLVVNGDIEELWNTDIQGYSMAGVYDTVLSHLIIKDYIGYDYIKDGYFNAGVLLINLRYWREHAVEKKLFDYLKTHQAKLNDQDALNAVLHGTIKPLHPKWNCHVGYFAFPPLVVSAQREYIKELWTGAKIIHFTGPAKPWYRECVNPYKYLYLKYKRMTPWRDKPLLRLEDSAWKSMRIIFLRKCKNVVARLVSYTYK